MIYKVFLCILSHAISTKLFDQSRSPFSCIYLFDLIYDYWHRVLNCITPQGDGNNSGPLVIDAFLCLTALPRKGTETSDPANHTHRSGSQCLTALPRKGTETWVGLEPCLPLSFVLNCITPQGDGNSSRTALCSFVIVLNCITPQGDGNP